MKIIFLSVSCALLPYNLKGRLRPSQSNAAQLLVFHNAKCQSKGQTRGCAVFCSNVLIVFLSDVLIVFHLASQEVLYNILECYCSLLYTIQGMAYRQNRYVI